MAETARRNRLPLFLLLAFVLLAAVFFWPEGVDENGPFEAPSVLNRGVDADPESWDRQATSTIQASIIFRDIGEGLVAYTASGEIGEGAAASWNVSPDGLVYTFKLRPDGRWSNGDPVTADDFVYTFRRLVDPDTKAPYADKFFPVTNAEAINQGNAAPDMLGVRALGPHTLEITLTKPTPYFLGLLTHASTHPQHTASIEALGDEHARPGNLVTNGAYRLVAAEPGGLIELERNEHYWNNANTSIDRVNYHVHTEAAAQYNRFRAGELHITSTLPLDIVASIRQSYPDEIRLTPSLGVYYYGFNVTRPPFKDNKNLRQALSLAIDRDVLAGTILNRGEVPAYSFVPPGIQGYIPQQLQFTNLSQDDRNDRAKSLYEDAGYGPGNHVEFELRYNTGDDHQRIAEAIQSMWRNVLGFEVKLVNVEFRVLLDQMYAGEITEAFRSAWNGDYADANTFLAILESDNPQNLPGWESGEYDEWMRRAAEQTNPEMRQRFLEEAERALLAEHAVVPLYFYVSKHLVSNEVCGWEDNVLDQHPSRQLSFCPAENGN